MNTLIVYDSFYGNTEAVARAVGAATGGTVKRASETQPGDVTACDLLIVGSPTQGGRPTKPLQAFLDAIPSSGLLGKRIAAFDTRFTAKWVKVFGYAADRIALVLQEKGGQPVTEPTCFYVKKEKGPLEDGELDRAAAWARDLISSV